MYSFFSDIVGSLFANTAITQFSEQISCLATSQQYQGQFCSHR